MGCHLNSPKWNAHLIHIQSSIKDHQWGGDSSVVRALDSWLKGHGFKSLRERQENFLCWLLFWYLFYPRVTAVARKRSRSSCQKCRWQVTAKHTYTLRMWLCLKWHGAWLYGVHRTHWDGSRFMWHQPCQHCKYTTLVDIKKHAIKYASHSCRITWERSDSAQERRIALYKSYYHHHHFFYNSMWMEMDCHQNSSLPPPSSPPLPPSHQKCSVGSHSK